MFELMVSSSYRRQISILCMEKQYNQASINKEPLDWNEAVEQDFLEQSHEGEEPTEKTPQKLYL